MSLKGIAVVAAGAIFFWAGVTALPADAQEKGEERCKGNEVSAAGAATYLGTGRAKRLAITNWQREVLAKYGERFIDFNKAKDGRFECERAGIGTVGSLKRRCIVRATPCRLAATSPEEEPEPTNEESRTLRIQQWLARLGFLNDEGVDGEYGPMTQQAVRRFQREQDLRVTGQVDEATYNRLRQRALSR
jgi:Putative peptidoglycan binding domain